MSRPSAAKSADRIDGAICTVACLVALTSRSSSAHLEGDRISLRHFESALRLLSDDRAGWDPGYRLRADDGHAEAAGAHGLGRALAVHTNQIRHHERRRLLAAIDEHGDLRRASRRRW